MCTSPQTHLAIPFSFQCRVLEGIANPNALATDESTQPIAHRCVQIPNAAQSSVHSLNVDDTYVSSNSVERGDDNGELAHFVCASMQSDIFLSFRHRHASALFRHQCCDRHK